MNCTFIGHKDAPESIKPKLILAIKELITQHNVVNFYVGNHGNFDHLVKTVLEQIKKEFPNINYTVVLAYRPKNTEDKDCDCDTLYSEEFDFVPKKLAIIKRNEWMIKRCDFIICYVTHTFGSSYKFKLLAEKKGKTVIEI